MSDAPRLKAMVERLQARARKDGLTLESRIMDGHALALENDTVDMAGSQFGVMLFPDTPRGIRELARVTKPGGTVVLVAFGSPQKIEFFNFGPSGFSVVSATGAAPASRASSLRSAPAAPLDPAAAPVA